MNLALDRDRIVQIFGGEAAARPTCQQLPPNYPGTSPTAPTRRTPAREGRGRGPPGYAGGSRLVRRSGTAGTRVVFE